MISTSETFPIQSEMADSSMHSSGGQQRSRHDSSPLVMLPAPLAVNGNNRPGVNSGLQHQSTSTTFSRNSEEVPLVGGGVGETGSRARLIPSPTGGDHNSGYGGSSEGYSLSPDAYSPPPPPPSSSSAGGVVLRQGTVMSASAYPGETANPYGRSQQAVVGYDNEEYGGTAETDSTSSEATNVGAGMAGRGRPQFQQQQQQQQQRRQSQTTPYSSAQGYYTTSPPPPPPPHQEQRPVSASPSRQQSDLQQQQLAQARARARGGVSLADNGPVPGPEGGVRRVSRPQARSTGTRPVSSMSMGQSAQGYSYSQQGQQGQQGQGQSQSNRYSRSSMYGGVGGASGYLPPGAAPPRPYGEQ